ncbi:F-box only protein 7 [Bulinus truncatus]|nr:F-box only protein 7 [Bulinus truncatus]
MKIKVKLDRESRVIDLGEITPAAVTLGELKSAAAQLYNLDGLAFHLSLNKRDTLGDETQNLSQFGIVSGDLLHIIGPDLPQTIRTDQEIRVRPQPLASYSNQVQPGNIIIPTTSSSSISMNEQSTSESVMSIDSIEDTTHEIKSPEVAHDDTGFTEMSNLDKDSIDINRFLHEPLVIRESTGTQVPILLEQLYTSANCSCTSDALWAVLHALMLESGYSPDGDVELTVMPSNYKKSGYYMSSYKFSISQDIVKTCVMVGVTMGTSVAVHAYPREGSDFRTEHLQLKTLDFVTDLSPNTPDTYRVLDRLSRLFMDTISLPLTNEIFTVAGFPGRQGLLALPYVVKIKILSFLGARSLCRLGQTCQEFASTYKDKTLWRLLYIRDFGKPSDTSLNKNWFELYKEQRIRRDSELEARRRMFHVDATDPPWGFPGGTGPFRPFNPTLPFPRMLGGDYDLRPEFAAGFPNLFNRRTPPPLPNPFIGGLNNLDPLQRPTTGNLAGSPFSNNFHQPFM